MQVHPVARIGGRSCEGRARSEDTIEGRLLGQHAHGGVLSDAKRQLTIGSMHSAADVHASDREALVEEGHAGRDAGVAETVVQLT